MRRITVILYRSDLISNPDGISLFTKFLFSGALIIYRVFLDEHVHFREFTHKTKIEEKLE